MPELPEVESLKLKLAPHLEGNRFAKIIFRRKDLRYPLPLGHEREITAAKIVRLRRRSKYLLCDFANDHTLVIHLGMSGRMFFADPRLDLNPHDHVLFTTVNAMHLRFRDPRRFGMIFWEKSATLNTNRFFSSLGVEPLEEAFNPDHLFRITRLSKMAIKSFLMDASRVVGVGNIYANEALYLSGIRPSRPAERISRADAGVLCANVKKILRESIDKGGTSFRDYVGANQEPGLYQLELFVYGRSGEKCRVCATIIKRDPKASRGTFYCPKCQR